MFKYSLTLLLFLFAAFFCDAQAIDKNKISGLRSAIKFHPLALIPIKDVHATLVSYEGVINQKTSIQLNGIFNYINLFNYVTHFGFGFEVRRYLFKSEDAPAGVYGGAGTAYSREKFRGFRDTPTSTSDEFSVKAIIGRQRRRGKRLSDINFGIKYKNVHFYSLSNNRPPTRGLIPAFNFGIGLGF